jgi:hypothetical protein
MTLCALQPAQGETRSICENIPEEALPDEGAPYAGYCYIDAMQDADGDGTPGECQVDGPQEDCIGNPQLVEGCEPSQRRILRIVSKGVPQKVPFGTSVLYVACQGQPIGT